MTHKDEIWVCELHFCTHTSECRNKETRCRSYYRYPDNTLSCKFSSYLPSSSVKELVEAAKEALGELYHGDGYARISSNLMTKDWQNCVRKLETALKQFKEDK